MSDRGSTGASSRYTRVPFSSSSSFATIETLISASIATHVTRAIALRMVPRLLQENVQHNPSDDEQDETGRRERSRFAEQRDVEQVVVTGHVKKKNEYAEAEQHAIPIRLAEQHDHEATGNARRLQRG